MGKQRVTAVGRGRGRGRGKVGGGEVDEGGGKVRLGKDGLPPNRMRARGAELFGPLARLV